MMKLRDYQQNSVNQVHQAWNNGNKNVMVVLATGGGKSVIVSDIVAHHQGSCCIIAHRQELVSQMSLHLARDGITHRIVASKAVIKMCVKMQMMEFGKCFYDPYSKVAVAGVQTIVRRGNELKNFLPTVTLWVIDEFHHHQWGTAKQNVWGNAIDMFTNPNVKGLGVTATPTRTDGGGLGRDTDGATDKMIIGTDMRTLINRRFLTDYRIFAPVSNIAFEKIKTSDSTGEFTQKSASEAVSHSSLVVHEKSTLVGDVVQEYIKVAKDKLAIVFVPSMDVGYELENQFNSVNIPAKLVNAKTPADERANIINQFANRQYMVLLNVSLFDEGFDLPAIECVIMASPTQSYGRYSQQFGRSLRLMEGKERAIIIDHVGNVARHGLPDSLREWTLDRREKKAKQEDDGIQIKICPECSAVYERKLLLKNCPECGCIHTPSNRSSIEEVEGELSELTDEMLLQLRGQLEDFNKPIDEQVEEYNKNLNEYIKPVHREHHKKLFREKLQINKENQENLRLVMAYYGGYHRAKGLSDGDIHRLFYIEHGIDWLSAMCLTGDACINLMGRLQDKDEIRINSTK